MNKQIFKGFKQVSSVDFEKAKQENGLAGYMWFVRTEVSDVEGNDVANDDYDIYFGSRQYGHFRAGEIAAIKSAIAALEGNVEAILKTLETLTGVVEANVEAIDALKEADNTIRNEFAAADEAVEGRVDEKLNALADRVAVNEGVLVDLVEADADLAAEVATKVNVTDYNTKIAEIEKAIEVLPTLAIKVVNELPSVEEEIDPKTLYLVKDKEEEGNLYTEYLYLDGKWENLGRQTVDFSDYYKRSEVNGLLDAKVDVVKGARLMTDAEGEKLAGIEAKAQVNVVEKVTVNGVEAVVDGKVASVEVEADDIELGTAITTDGTDLKEDNSNLKYAADSKLSTVLQSIYTAIRVADAGGVKSVTASDTSVEVNSNDANNPTVKVRVSSEADNLLSVKNDGLFVAMYYEGDDAE